MCAHACMHGARGCGQQHKMLSQKKAKRTKKGKRWPGMWRSFEEVFIFKLRNLSLLDDSISNLPGGKSHKAELLLYPAVPMIRRTIYSIDCALSDSLSGDQASLCSLSLLILFLLRNLFFSFALGKLNWLVWILQCSLQTRKVSPGPESRSPSSRSHSEAGGAACGGAEPPATDLQVGCLPQAQGGGSWQNSRRAGVGGGRGEAVSQHPIPARQTDRDLIAHRALSVPRL